MSDDFNLDTHCVVCQEPRSTHPTESNNPRPLFQEGRACRDCDTYIIAARMKTWGIADDNARAFVLRTLHDFLKMTATIRLSKKHAAEMLEQLKEDSQ